MIIAGECQIPATVREWSAAQKLIPAHEDLLKIAAEFQFYLFKFDRPSLEQVISTQA